MKNYKQPCPCNSGHTYRECCEKIQLDHSQATTPEQLMRARYSGFYFQKEQFLLQTHHPLTRPRKLSLQEDGVQWLSLEVHSGSKIDSTTTEAEVSFTATYIQNMQLCSLYEKSRFFKVKGLWYYMDGEPQLTTEQLNRSSPCPCGSKKKFKRCCLPKTGVND